MKKVKSWSSLLLGCMLAASTVMVGCEQDDSGMMTQSQVNRNYVISGTANGSQMVPSVSGNGNATITGNYNAATRLLNYTVNWTGLSGAPTMGGFYNGGSGSAGTLVGTNWTLGTGLNSNGTYSGSTSLTDAQLSQLSSGNWYYSLGTATNTGGEVRGQITATP
jgi:hypothetical protein